LSFLDIALAAALLDRHSAWLEVHLPPSLDCGARPRRAPPRERKESGGHETDVASMEAVEVLESLDAEAAASSTTRSGTPK
jgi:hypothetical protein